MPAGNGRPSGRWSSGSYGNGDRPRVVIDTTTWDGDPSVGDAGADDGSGDSGSTDAGSDASLSAFDLGDVSSEVGSLGLFNIAPRDNTVYGGVQLAGDPPDRLPEIVVTPGEAVASSEPGIGHNQGPPLEDPPEIPRTRPRRSKQRTARQRATATWIKRAIKAGAIARLRSFFAAIKLVS